MHKGTWFPFDPAMVMADIMDMTDAEAGKWLKQLLKSLVHGERGMLPIADKMLDERETFIDGKRKAGIAGMKARWGKRKPSTGKGLNNGVITKRNQYKTIQDKTEQGFLRSMEGPTLDEVLTQAEVIGLQKAEAVKFHEFWTGAGWRDREGRQVRNWRLKLSSWKLSAQGGGFGGRGAAQARGPAGGPARVGGADYDDASDPILRAAREQAEARRQAEAEEAP